MKNQESWKPSKFVYRKEKLIASRDPLEVSIGSRLITDIIAEHYDLYIKKYVRGKLLDLGCGKVPLFEAYKDYITENICIDRENSLYNNEYLDLNCDLTQNLLFKDEEFDTIILSDVLEHIYNPEHLLKEISRILAKEGKLLMNVPFYYWLHDEPLDYFRYTEFALQYLIESAKLKVVVLKPIGGAPEILADIIAKNILSFPKTGKLLASSTLWMASIFLKTNFGKKLSKATAKKFPLGYFLIAEKT